VRRSGGSRGANEEEVEELLLPLVVDAAHVARFCRSFAR
jgi:hypothetical protein